jgi:L-ascorbate metabolism protein UlaG (beta-lactamase superfamily)
VCAVVVTVSAAERTTLTWHGHAAFEVTTPSGKIILIDPWLNNPLNPFVKEKRDPVERIAKADYILVTHGHFDSRFRGKETEIRQSMTALFPSN